MSCSSRRFDDPTLSDAERSARRRIARLRGFYSHLAVFVAVNVGLLLINLVAAPGRWWFHWPLMGWGIGLLIHAFATFSHDRWLGADWERRKLEQFMAEEKKK